MNAGLQAQVKTPARPSCTPVRTGLLQRKCACGGTPGPSGECEECRKKRLQRKVAQPSTLNHQHSEVPPIVHEVLHSSGQPLDAATRAFMEPRFGHDFSRVRVHANSLAAESARAVDALAYTVGQDVVFRAGRYAPKTTAGQRLLAHELTHTIQQADQIQSELALNPSGDVYEREADRVASTIARGEPFVMPEQRGVGLMRAEPDAEDANEKELKDKLKKLRDDKFGGDNTKAFDAYDADHDGACNREEITNLLKDADVGNYITRGQWVAGLLAKVDTNHNGKVERAEFEAALIS